MVGECLLQCEEDGGWCENLVSEKNIDHKGLVNSWGLAEDNLEEEGASVLVG